MSVHKQDVASSATAIDGSKILFLSAFEHFVALIQG